MILLARQRCPPPANGQSPVLGIRRPHALLLLLLALSAPLNADHDEAFELAREGEILPLAQILEHQRQAHPGRILEVELEREGGQWVYELEVLDDAGRVREIYYDAVSGQPLPGKADDD